MLRVVSLAREISFRDHSRSVERLSRLAADLPTGVQDRLAVLLRASADPDSALHYLHRLQEEQRAAFHRLSRSPAALQCLITVFSYSRFLAEELLRKPEWVEPLPQSGDLHRILSSEEYARRLQARLARYTAGGTAPEEFATFRREQTLRILLRDLLGFGTLSDITEELSNLADAILDCAWQRIQAGMTQRHGTPRLESGAECKFSIVALGKLGGRELNYSSDVDLLFLYGGPGETSGVESLSNKEYYKKACIQLTELLSRYGPHGMSYRVDLRLRPEGALGEVCISLDGAKTYYRSRARDWELQMLIKARPAAGDFGPARELIEFTEPLTYSSSLDFSMVEAVSEARMRIHERLARRRGNKEEFDVKLAPGGIRDVEFLVQCLQRLHGGREPWVQHAGTLHALFRLRSKDLLSEIEYGRLAPAYIFFRNLEHRLQFLEDRQTHILPSDADELEVLARRMTSAQIGSEPSAARLMQELKRHLDGVQEVYDRVVHTQLPVQARTAKVPEADEPQEPHPVVGPVTVSPEDPVSVNLTRMLNQRAPGLAGTLSRSRLRYGGRAFEHFLERMLPSPEWLRWLDEDSVLCSYVIDIFEHSPFFAEQLNRKPELIEELRQMRLKPESTTRYGEMPPLLADPADLRRFFSREMLRIQCESICLQTPIFDTLKRTSGLADCAIATAYSMALDEVAVALPPVSPHYRPRDQMTVIALGRLGMQEFDLASDADLVFVLGDRDSEEHPFWTHVAERVVDLLTAYTGDGQLFAVDTRLRPNGREGPLVQTESTFKNYFSNTAQAWEGITYMKARAVAGGIEGATAFLHELQDVDWRRYGQGGRSKAKLNEMRHRLEKEQGRENPLKAGRGGYYDIDFALMFLRLKSAGIFYKVLNTPERIDIIEKMGHLDRADAQFLLDAATFYRALDHGLRLSSGHAEGRLPAAQHQVEILSELVSRWTPEHLHDQPLPEELEQIQARTREFFERLFA